MTKIWTVLKSEYLRRVMTKGFVIGTLVTPIAVLAFIALMAFVGFMAARGGEDETVAVVDRTGVLADSLVAGSTDELTFVVSGEPEAAVRAAVEAGDYAGYLLLEPAVLEGGGAGVTYYTPEGGGLAFRGRLEDRLEGIVERYRLAEQQTPPEVLAILDGDVDVRLVRLTDEGEAADDTVASTILGFVIGFFIYMAMFIYGGMVLQGVLEEKTSRVVEVMVSSVRPFELMMGKVLGIGAMGLTQMITWGVLIFGGLLVLGPLLALFGAAGAAGAPPADASTEAVLEQMGIGLPSISPFALVAILLFFLGGYLLYASLYAAVGASVEQMQDAQSLMIPIMIPIIISFVFINFVVEDPNGTLSTVLTMIPFSSPILMVVRMAITDVPVWEVLLSLALLIGAFAGTIWLSARIYRVGILMYGKKPSLRDLARWVRTA